MKSCLFRDHDNIILNEDLKIIKYSLCVYIFDSETMVTVMIRDKLWIATLNVSFESFSLFFFFLTVSIPSLMTFQSSKRNNFSTIKFMEIQFTSSA